MWDPSAVAVTVLNICALLGLVGVPFAVLFPSYSGDHRPYPGAVFRYDVSLCYVGLCIRHGIATRYFGDRRICRCVDLLL